ncbi:nitrate transporter, partial [Acinetobacter nectaris]|nr:nitrate transporter [Acinetobacter nectaris]
LQDYGIIQFECSESIHVESYYKLIEVIKNLSDTTKPKAFDFEWIIKQMCKWDNLILEEKEINKFAKMCIYERS